MPSGEVLELAQDAPRMLHSCQRVQDRCLEQLELPVFAQQALDVTETGGNQSGAAADRAQEPLGLCYISSCECPLQLADQRMSAAGPIAKTIAIRLAGRIHHSVSPLRQVLPSNYPLIASTTSRIGRSGVA